MKIHLTDAVATAIADNLPEIYSKLGYLGRDSDRKGVFSDDHSKLDYAQLEYLAMFLADHTT